MPTGGTSKLLFLPRRHNCASQGLWLAQGPRGGINRLHNASGFPKPFLGFTGSMFCLTNSAHKRNRLRAFATWQHLLTACRFARRLVGVLRLLGPAVIRLHRLRMPYACVITGNCLQLSGRFCDLGHLAEERGLYCLDEVRRGIGTRWNGMLMWAMLSGRTVASRSSTSPDSCALGDP